MYGHVMNSENNRALNSIIGALVGDAASMAFIGYMTKSPSKPSPMAHQSFTHQMLKTT